MNLFEMIVFLLNMAIGFVAAQQAYAFGGFWLVIPGFVLGFIFLPTILVLFSEYDKWAYPGREDLPACACGANEYRYEAIGTTYQLLCANCHKRYLRKPRQLSVYENGVEELYAELKRRKGWVRSNADANAPSARAEERSNGRS